MVDVDKGEEDNKFIGIDINHGIGDSKKSYVWEPLLVKVNALKAATEAACTILSIDETVRNPKSEQDEQQKRIKKAMPRR
jgi:T-complex protein 1 subunit eta